MAKFVRIKAGSTVGQDFAFGKWPWARDPVDENKVFWAEEDSMGWVCRADGFGFGILGQPNGAYGCGAIHVIGKDAVVEV